MQVNSISSSTNINNSKKSSGSVNGDGSFQSYLGETKELDTIFRKAAKTYGVDVNLLKSVARVESNFRKDAVSCVGAVGIMQLMPRTAKGLGVKNSYDPEQNIMGGAKLLSQLLDKYDQDVELALAGYNAGSGNVKKYGGVPPWESVHKYINKVLGFYKESGSGTVTTNSSVAATNKTEKQAETIKNEPKVEEMSSAISTAYYQAGTTSTTDQLTAMLDALNISSEASRTELEHVFSYDKYLKFIELYFEEQEKEKKDTKEEENSIMKNASQLQISSSVSNMLKQV